MKSSSTSKQKVPKLPSVKRLPAYLHELKLLREAGNEMVSTTYLAGKLNLEPIVVRKDLELAERTGLPGIGYKVDDLIAGIENFLGWNGTTPVFLIGAGSLGTALLGFRGFKELGFNIIAAFDTDPAKVGTLIHDKPVYAMEELEAMVSKHQVKIGFLCVPHEFAQRAADEAAAGGLRAIWNFTNTPLNLPHDMVQQKVNLAGELAELTVRLAGRLESQVPDDKIVS